MLLINIILSNELGSSGRERLVFFGFIISSGWKLDLKRNKRAPELRFFEFAPSPSTCFINVGYS